MSAQRAAVGAHMRQSQPSATFSPLSATPPKPNMDMPILFGNAHVNVTELDENMPWFEHMHEYVNVTSRWLVDYRRRLGRAGLETLVRGSFSSSRKWQQLEARPRARDHWRSRGYTGHRAQVSVPRCFMLDALNMH